ncbi:carbohydrate ABC transporter permease [Alicyclobacillus fastidiosus]|uniref:Carbohydrate ABC transporter permease n=1 Tax=Alicyclobacillus fastidiosus TaxID=392011 RepID=A0ABY6ZQY8_9BACL|nr:carbohydrate ABC transporter permease [Alicyclobacillus fastidiosus]WAH44531.1 carbohydrate ABC transporter permease [Alicyclobacillus fastidiosus]
MAKQRKNTILTRGFLHIFLIIFGLFMLYPIIWMAFSSFKTDSDIFSSNLFPTHWIITQYTKGWSALPGVNFGKMFGNSFFIAILVVIGSLFTSSLTGFAFARLRFRFKAPLFAMLMITMMLPSQVTLIPQYIVFHKIGWVNTFYPLIVPSFIGASPFFTFLTVQFIRGIPKELDEAAKIDGCNMFQIYWRIILPLTKPALVTISIFSFYWTWNDFFGQLVYLNSPSKYTVALGLQSFLDQQGSSQWGQMFAMSMLSLIPVFIIFIFFQRYLTKGIATTGLKG